MARRSVKLSRARRKGTSKARQKEPHRVDEAEVLLQFVLEQLTTRSLRQLIGKTRPPTLSRRELIELLIKRKWSNPAKKLATLSRAELRRAFRRLPCTDSWGLDFGSTRDLSAKLLERSQKEIDGTPMARYWNYPLELDDDADLAEWAARYCRSAESDGQIIDFDPTEYWQYEFNAASTIALVAEAAFQSDIAGLLDWQKYGGPGGSGVWYTLNCHQPLQWLGARLYLRDPFAFRYPLLLFGHGSDVEFSITRNKPKRWKNQERIDLADDIDNWLTTEFDEDDYQLIFTRASGGLGVLIERAWVTRDDETRRDENGRLWFL